MNGFFLNIPSPLLPHIHLHCDIKIYQSALALLFFNDAKLT